MEGFIQVVKPGKEDRGNGKMPGIGTERMKTEAEEPWVEDDLDDGSLLDAVVGDVKVRPPVETEFVSARQMVREEDTRIQEARLKVEAAPVPITNPWDDFFVSNTQVEREISFTPPEKPKPVATALDSIIDCLSTEDVSLSAEDLEELDCATPSKAVLHLALPGRVVESRVLANRNQTELHDLFSMPPPRRPPARPIVELPKLYNNRTDDTVRLSLPQQPLARITVEGRKLPDSTTPDASRMSPPRRPPARAVFQSLKSTPPRSHNSFRIPPLRSESLRATSNLRIMAAIKPQDSVLLQPRHPQPRAAKAPLQFTSVDPDPFDFCLSTQDFREIEC